MKVRLEKFTLSVGNNKLYNNVNFAFEDGKFLLLGANGSGKSSLLDVLYKINNKYEGNIYLDESNLKSISKYKLRNEIIGYINQQDTLFEYLTIGENILLLVKDQMIRNKIIGKLKEEFDFTTKELVSDLSGGEKQYLKILLEIYNHKKILLIDEPFNNLSKRNTQRIKTLISDSDKFIILVNHKQTDIDIENIVNIEDKDLILCKN